MAAWADQEVFKLVELWGEDSVQEQLEGCKRNSQVYDRIAREMQIAGFDRTGQQSLSNTINHPLLSQTLLFIL